MYSGCQGSPRGRRPRAPHKICLPSVPAGQQLVPDEHLPASAEPSAIPNSGNIEVRGDVLGEAIRNRLEHGWRTGSVAPRHLAKLRGAGA
jgi:hypothetical protein